MERSALSAESMQPVSTGTEQTARTTRSRLPVVLAALCFVGVAAAALGYYSYSREWLRRPRAPSCAMAARAYMKNPVLSSGTEPHDAPNGETVYLTEPEDRAVRCAKGVSMDLGVRLTGALVEQEPEKKTAELVKIMKDVQPGSDHDIEAAVAYHLASSAMIPMPELPEKKAALNELDQMYGCRFQTSIQCPARPGIPWYVWGIGVPSVAGFIGFSAVAGIRRLRARSKKAPKAA